jgi:hypothetical protein
LLSLFNYAKDSVLPQRSKKSFWISSRLSKHLQKTQNQWKISYHSFMVTSLTELNITNIDVQKKVCTSIFTPLNLLTSACVLWYISVNIYFIFLKFCQ